MMQVGGVARMCLIAAVIAGISGLARGGEAGGSGGRKVNLLVVGDLGFPMPEQKLTAGAMAGYVRRAA